MLIFHSYVKLPEGNLIVTPRMGGMAKSLLEISEKAALIMWRHNEIKIFHDQVSMGC